MKILFRFEIFVVFICTLEFEKTFIDKFKDKIKNHKKTKKNPETRFNEEHEVVELLRHSKREVVEPLRISTREVVEPLRGSTREVVELLRLSTKEGVEPLRHSAIEKWLNRLDVVQEK